MAPVLARFSFQYSIKLPPIEFSWLKLRLRENFRSRETQNVMGVKVTRNVKIVKRIFCIKKTHTFTIITMNFVQEQLKRKKERERDRERKREGRERERERERKRERERERERERDRVEEWVEEDWESD